MIPYGRQDINESDIEAVVAVLRSDFITQGPVIPAFERTIADYCSAFHAVAVSSATAALHLSCLALDLGPGGLAWTSPNTFAASANCARYCGADVDFVDIDPKTFNMDMDDLEAKLELAKVKGRLPDIVIPVDFAGQSCDMERLWQLAKQYGFSVIEDASHAVGADYKGRKVGSCSYSDITVFSFHPVKIITTGEGGIALTNRQGIAQKLVSLRSHGITRDAARLQHGDAEGNWYFEQQELGYNYRLTDLQAALGLSQMSRLDAFIARRRQLAARYGDLLKDLRLQLPYEMPDRRSSYHLYPIWLDPDGAAVNRRDAYDRMHENGIGVQIHYIPVHLHPYYRRLGFKPGDFPKAESYYQGTLSLPLFPLLSDDQQDRVADELHAALRK